MIIVSKRSIACPPVELSIRSCGVPAEQPSFGLSDWLLRPKHTASSSSTIAACPLQSVPSGAAKLPCVVQRNRVYPAVVVCVVVGVDVAVDVKVDEAVDVGVDVTEDVPVVLWLLVCVVVRELVIDVVIDVVMVVISHPPNSPPSRNKSSALFKRAIAAGHSFGFLVLTIPPICNVSTYDSPRLYSSIIV